jgi:hypothetical protein
MAAERGPYRTISMVHNEHFPRQELHGRLKLFCLPMPKRVYMLNSWAINIPTNQGCDLFFFVQTYIYKCGKDTEL